MITRGPIKGLAGFISLVFANRITDDVSKNCLAFGINCLQDGQWPSEEVDISLMRHFQYHVVRLKHPRSLTRLQWLEVIHSRSGNYQPACLFEQLMFGSHHMEKMPVALLNSVGTNIPVFQIGTIWPLSVGVQPLPACSFIRAVWDNHGRMTTALHAMQCPDDYLFQPNVQMLVREG